jgi:hypothetical protein
MESTDCPVLQAACCEGCAPRTLFFLFPFHPLFLKKLLAFSPLMPSYSRISTAKNELSSAKRLTPYAGVGNN